jgi:hypothetical protein
VNHEENNCLITVPGGFLSTALAEEIDARTAVQLAPDHRAMVLTGICMERCKVSLEFFTAARNQPLNAI